MDTFQFMIGSLRRELEIFLFDSACGHLDTD